MRDEIHLGPKHDFRLPPGRWLVVAVALALIAATATLIMTAQTPGRAPRHQAPSAAAVAPTPSPTGAPGTLLLTCGSADWGDLGKGWRAGSLKVGPIWLVYARQFAHLLGHGRRGTDTDILRPRHFEAAMIVEVSDGSTVVMRVADKAQPYFHFVDGFDGPAGHSLPKGDAGFTLSSCPKGRHGPNGPVTDFRLGFVIDAGRTAMVDIQTLASSHSIRLIFTSPRQGTASGA